MKDNEKKERRKVRGNQKKIRDRRKDAESVYICEGREREDTERRGGGHIHRADKK